MRTLNRNDTNTEKSTGFYQRFLKGGKPARCGEQVSAVFAWTSAASSSGKRLAGRATATLYVVSRAKTNTTINTDLSAGWVGYEYGHRKVSAPILIFGNVAMFLMYQGKRRSRKSGAPVLMAAGGLSATPATEVFADFRWLLLVSALDFSAGKAKAETRSKAAERGKKDCGW